MPVAQLDIESTLYDLNQLRLGGVLLTNQEEISRLERNIVAMKAFRNGQPPSMERVAQYYITLASLRCLTGDFDLVVTLGEEGLKLTRQPQVIINHVVSLAVAGFFSKARKLLDRLSGDELLDMDPNQNILAIMANCQLYGIEEGVMNSLAERFPHNVKSMGEAKKILAALDISEEQVLAMMDLAGALTRNKGIFFPNDAQLHTYPSDKFMTISLPVKLSPREVAELEWEYIGQAIEMFPDMPFSSISIGFCGNHYA